MTPDDYRAAAARESNLTRRGALEAQAAGLEWERALRRRMAQAAADAGHPWGEASLRQMDDTDHQEGAR